MHSNDRSYVASGQAARGAIDSGLRDHMNAVYRMMAVAVALTGLVSWAFGTSPALLGLVMDMESGGMRLLGWISLFSPLVIVLAMGLGASAMSKATMQLLLYGLATLMGISLSTIFVVYTGASIASTFLVTASAFAGLSIYGHTTKRDLSAIGAFLVMGLIGLILASIVNLFMQSTAMGFALNVAGVVIFAGLTAWDTQKIKQIYLDQRGASSAEDIGKAAVFGALSLYLDFINLFLHLLKLLGQKK